MLKGKNIVITGATGGIGSALTKKATQMGAKIMMLARTRENLEKLASELDNVFSYPVDVTNLDDLSVVIQKIQETHGKIDIVIHAVGEITLRPLHALSQKQFRNSLEINLISAFNIMKSTIRGMMKRKTGSYVFISSVAGKKGMRNHEAISASKSGLEGLVRSAAITYAPRGIRFNGVALGLIETSLARKNKLTTTEKLRQIANEMHPLGRYGQVDDVVDQILFLASDKASWTTGVFVPIDGGLSTN